jgi:hypothetical protein
LKEKCVAVMTTKRKYYNSAQLLDAFESSSPLTNEHPTSVPQPSSYHQQPQTNCRDCPKRRSHQSHYQSSGVTIQSKVSQHHPQMARTIVLPVASHKYNHFAMLLLTLASTSRSVLGFASRSTFVSSLSHSKAWTARKYSSTTLSMKLQTAIVGLPNVGKVRTIILLLHASKHISSACNHACCPTATMLGTLECTCSYCSTPHVISKTKLTWVKGRCRLQFVTLLLLQQNPG